jgi:CubicO group peptidase (beta-lactamase class C family)
LLRIALAACLLLLVAAVVLWLRPPDLLRVGANYSAKIVCSNVFIAGREPEDVLRTDVQAPGIALLRLMRISVDRSSHVVHAGLFGFIGGGLAVARPRTGCAAVPDGNLDFAMRVNAVAEPDLAATRAQAHLDAGSAASATDGPADSAIWPDGNGVATDGALDHLLADDALAGPGMRAIVVVHHGRIVAERYADGFPPSMPLLGWSMTKSVIAGLVGVLVKEGRLTLDRSAGWPPAARDERERIRVADLLSMSSGLRFNEGYGVVSDITRMLYLKSDMAGFARAQPLVHAPGTYWSYSSGSANILSRIVQDAAGGLGAAYPTEKLFKPLGMTSAIIETDEDGTMVGSSYMYATARDWARYGQFLLQDGTWKGQDILPRGFVAHMASPVAASNGQYGQGLVWLNAGAPIGIPADAFWMQGHDGQSTAIIPSRELVVVRLGLTPASENYSPQPLVKALLDALP